MRLKGTWNIKDYTFNCVSIVPQLNALSSNSNLSDISIQYGENSEKQWYTYIYVSNKLLYHSYDLFNDDTQFYFDPNRVYDSLCNKWFFTPFRLVKNVGSNWKVFKLYENDLNIVLNTDTGEYKIFLKNSK
ncbi:MAG: hypothetical protein IPM51_05035 [Sphingobacteriaceae bacterium]|nr:hypothetical protein [Sphingobacteriaceae bacterium]